MSRVFLKKVKDDEFRDDNYGKATDIYLVLLKPCANVFPKYYASLN